MVRILRSGFYVQGRIFRSGFLGQDGICHNSKARIKFYGAKL